MMLSAFVGLGGLSAAPAANGPSLLAGLSGNTGVLSAPAPKAPTPMGLPGNTGVV